MSNDKFSELLNKLSKLDDPFSQVMDGMDIRLASHIPFGIPTGVPELDLALHRPGYPVGRIVEIFGFENSGKTTLGLHAIASAQRMGGHAMFIDTERTYDPKRASEIGVDPSRLLVADADSIEAVFRLIQRTMTNLVSIAWDGPFVVLVDSITAVQSEQEISRELGEEGRVGQDARTIRTALRKLTKDIATTKILPIFINHSISTIASSPFGEKSTSAGGRALKLWASVRVNTGFLSNLTEGKDPKNKIRVGQKILLRIKKNKVEHLEYPDFKIELTKKGFDVYKGLWEALLRMGELKLQSGRTYFFEKYDVQVVKDAKKWESFVDDRGGPEAMYDWFMNVAQASGFITPYGAIPVIQEPEEEESSG